MPSSPSGAHSAVDCVSSDIFALAAHMRDCAQARGRWPTVRSGLQRAHALTAGRIVTVGCAVAVIGLGLLAAA